jgi:hypothetical protein
MPSTSQKALFCSGVFFGGAVDHAILALKRVDRTPYGLKRGVVGNWAFAATDALLAAGFYELHRRSHDQPDRGN